MTREVVPEVVKIGGASGFWGDTAIAVPQLLGAAELDYLVFDYLAEVTMSILAAQRAKDPAAGYATDFVQIMMKEALPTLKRRGIRVVANAGGVNPLACRDALLALASELGIELKVGVVLGDDLRVRTDEFAAAGVSEMFSGAPFPKRVASVNAYLGAFPIARALDAGCDVVITGRCVDSAVTLGVLIHEFGWTEQQLDQLAQGTLAGHLIECGAQGTGGLFTDWEQVPDWENIGFPIIEAFADGRFTPISELDAAFTRPRTPDGVTIAYFQASQVCEFVEEKYGFDGILRMLALYKEGRRTPDVLQQAFRGVEAGMIVSMDVCQDSLVARFSQVTVRVVTRIGIDAATPESRQRVQVIGIGLAGFQYEVPIDFGNEYGRSIDPSIIRQLPCGLLDSHKTAMPLMESLEKLHAIFKEARILNCGFAADDSLHRAKFGKWLCQITFDKNKTAHFEGRPHDLSESPSQYGFGAALYKCALNAGCQSHRSTRSNSDTTLQK